MPTDKRDIRLVRLFLEKYNADSGSAYNIAELPEETERNKKAVEAIARDTDGCSIAIEHTIIQPFVGDKADAQPFRATLAPLEQDSGLVVPEFDITLAIPVGAVQKGVDWNDIRDKLGAWFVSERNRIPEGPSQHKVPGLDFELPLSVHKTPLPGFPGKVFVSRSDMPQNFDDVMRKALATKVPKLAATNVTYRILLLEKDSPPQGYHEIAEAIEHIQSDFPDLTKVHEVWVVNTVAWDSENAIWFIPVWPERVRGYKLS